MTRQYRLEAALLPDGWARDVVVGISDEGCIETIERPTQGATGTPTAEPAGDPADERVAERVAGIVVPGMSNAHSHAFQRGMAGNAEYRASARDSFWTWRNAMYELANRIEPGDLELIATQLFVEMLKAGYTSVAEFHYLHRQAGGELYPQHNELWQAVTEAAVVAGIALTFLPTLYQTGDFGAQPLKREQARFALDTERFLRDIADRVAAERHSKPAALRTGAAFHSLRAVPLPVLREAAAALRAMDPRMPLHIHVAEQTQEVEACQEHTGMRPIELLLDAGLLDPHWCLVHATHATPAELTGIVAAGATVCVSISTEANLGDGFFDTTGYLAAGGRVCVGSDSQATVSPAEELRWMEYQLRLRERRRVVLADASEPHVGTRLWGHAARHGAEAIGREAGEIAVGRRADWLVLERGHPSMAGARLEASLDHLVFAGGRAAIRDVMVAGRWIVKDRHHAAELPLRPRFAELMARLA
jgi:formimidoylglutamate deiminase